VSDLAIQNRNDIRNVAIIAHVDHGKTTLVDGMLLQTNVFREGASVQERVLDSNALEKERGITILAKNTAVTYKNTKINIVDTPGHADFGGEVERVLNMVDGALLLIDSVEGPMPQTRFVLRKALGLGLRVLVVVNKIDRANARPEEVLNETFDLFIELGASDEQAEFPVVYAIGLHGRAGLTPDDLANNLNPLFDTILEKVPAPQVDLEAPSSMLVTTLDYDRYIGQLSIGRIYNGRIAPGMPLVRITPDGERNNGRVEKLYTFHNLGRQEATEALAGDIVALSGFETINISDTLADPTVTEGLPAIAVEDPTVRMTFGVNTSPLAGREGKTGLGTSRRLRERLYNETRSNVALRVEDGVSPEKFVVSGRGELHLGILIETMRREGYEFEVSKPEVIFIDDEDGRTLEPVEELQIEVADSASGPIMEMLGLRRGQMLDMRTENGTTFMKYRVPTRGLLGFQSHFMRMTSGLGQASSIFDSYQPLAGEVPKRKFGSLVAMEGGPATAYAILNVQARGTFFVDPGTDIYEGMVVGEHIRADDLGVNVCKEKHVTNHRSKPTDTVDGLVPARRMSLDDFIEFLAEDELLEVTPISLRVRKRILDINERQREQKRLKQKVGA